MTSIQGFNSQHDWQQLTQALTRLHKHSLDLSCHDNQDSLFQAAIEMIRHILPVDRVGFLLLDSQAKLMRGTWGINEQGEIEDCRNYYRPLPDMPWVAQSLANKDYVAFWDNSELMFKGRVVGQGWNAMSGLWNGDQCLGWIAFDNLLRKGTMPPWLPQALGALGQMMGHLLSRLEYLQELKRLNTQLEQLVEQRTAELQEQLNQVQLFRHELHRSEQSATIGNLVGGVAHEINTPLGNAITALSAMEEAVAEHRSRLQANQLTRSDLDGLFDHIQQSQQIISTGLQKASLIVRDFRQMADYQHQDESDLVSLFALVNKMLSSHHNQLKRRPIQVHNRIEPELCFMGQPGKLTQILTQLLQNSLQHAFTAEQAGNIEIQAEIQDRWLLLSFSDTGQGVAEDQLEKIFDAFFSTAKDQGHSGMGLNIVYTLVQEMQGHINAYANHPKGLIIVIRIPLGEPEHDQLQP